jgi:hypothetical protein
VNTFEPEPTTAVVLAANVKRPIEVRFGLPLAE